MMKSVLFQKYESAEPVAVARTGTRRRTDTRVEDLAMYGTFVDLGRREELRPIKTAFEFASFSAVQHKRIDVKDFSACQFT